MAERHLHKVPTSPPGGESPTPQVPSPERRRASWREFRQAYPGILTTMTIALVVMLALDAWLIARRVRYQTEIDRLRSGMSDMERRRTDALLASNENKLRVMVELVRRQAQLDKSLHVKVSVDSGVMYLEREGALLRDMPVQVGPEKRIGMTPDTIHMAAPRGARTVERVLGEADAWEVPAWVYIDRGVPAPVDRALQGALGPAAVVLNGGTLIYAMPSVGPLNDSTYVLPGSIRARAADLKAIVPNLKPGMTVYFY